MRPHVMTPDKGLQPDAVARLYAHRDTMSPRAWVLSWSRPGSNVSCGAEGECSRIYHRTMRAAVNYGVGRYGERATRAPWN